MQHVNKISLLGCNIFVWQNIIVNVSKIPKPLFLDPYVQYCKYSHTSKHTSLFVGHSQTETVQTQIRCHGMQYLIRFFTVYSQSIILKFKQIRKYHPTTLKLEMD